MIEWLSVIILSMSPISELRGGIPAGIMLGLDPFMVFCAAVLFNALVFFPIFFGLKFFYHKVERFRFVRSIVEMVRKREKGFVRRYGAISLILFVAIPLPVTGAWTGSILAWLFNLNWRKSFIAVSIGVLFAGVIILSGTLGGIGLLGG